jgi:hypothetical protein
MSTEDWCDENLAEIFQPGMFDDEEISEEVWENFAVLVKDSVLSYIDDADECDEMMDRMTEAAQEWFRGYQATLIEAIEPSTPTALLERPQTTQHSADWYNERKNRLTASEFAQILDGRRGALMRSKLAPPVPVEEGAPISMAPVGLSQSDGDMIATSWGHRFEPLTRKIYELEIAGVDSVCDTLGRFTHPDHPWLSASPDGVVLSGPQAGRLVEIKSPKSRQPESFIPSEYYVQMQIQMEVCDVDTVDFIEAQMRQRHVGCLSDEDEAALMGAHWKGRIRVFGKAAEPATWVYRYSEPVEDLADADCVSTVDGLDLLEDSVWWLTGWFPRTVMRNRDWWSSVGWPAASLFWSQVVSARSDQIETIESIDSPPPIARSWSGSSS